MRTSAIGFRISGMSKNSSPGRRGDLRIIGGRWRGRRLSLLTESDVRPTGDRVRETLFNWLGPIIDGARCLDLFAGSGALGLEALSRGAGEMVFVERDAAVVRQLDRSLEQLECGDATVVHGDALQFLNEVRGPFDIVFVDPPFGDIDLGNVCKLLERGWLAHGARIYLEMSRRDDLPDLPAGWVVDRDKTAGQVRFALASRA